MKLTVPKTSLTSTDANSQDNAGKLQENFKKSLIEMLKESSIYIMQSEGIC